MERSRKFYLTPTQIVDVDIVADAEFFPDGIPPETSAGSGSGLPEFRVIYKHQPGNNKVSITLSADAAITAWKNYCRAVGENWEFLDDEPEPKEYRMELGTLREHLKLFSDDHEVIFGNGNLEFYRTKLRGEKLVQIEFSQMTDMIPDQP